MKMQAINTGSAVNAKGHVLKPGKFTNLAYSAIFATSLIGATDCFTKSANTEKQPPKTEVTASLQSDEEFEEQLLEILQERKRQREAEEAIERYKEGNAPKLNIDSYNTKLPKEDSGAKGFFLSVLGGAFIGWITKRVTNEIKYG